jgi:hypothetical protein
MFNIAQKRYNFYRFSELHVQKCDARLRIPTVLSSGGKVLGTPVNREILGLDLANDITHPLWYSVLNHTPSRQHPSEFIGMQ